MLFRITKLTYHRGSEVYQKSDLKCRISKTGQRNTIYHRDNDKARKSSEHGPENGKRKFNQTRRRSDNGRSARVDCHIYRKRNHDVTLSVLSLGHFISFSFAAKEVKGATYFPSRAKDLEI